MIHQYRMMCTLKINNFFTGIDPYSSVSNLKWVIWINRCQKRQNIGSVSYAERSHIAKSLAGQSPCERMTKLEGVLRLGADLRTLEFKMLT